MNKYSVTLFKNPIRICSRAMWLDNFYIQMDYINKHTIISKIEVCFLCDTVQINKLLPLNVDNPYEMLDKIKTLLLFS